ncbi:MAG: LysM peptidoglycan-binding domain-containing M23 family metallopeptidase [Blastomonas sp.]
MNSCATGIERARTAAMHMVRAVLILFAAGQLSACIPQGSGSYSRPASTSAPSSASPVLPTDPQVLADTPQTWEARAVTPNAASVSGGDYVVQPGDTLRAIGNRTGAGSEAIALANGLEPPFTIYPGQRLTIPQGQFHLVSQGETGIAIARAYGVSWADIVTLNALEEPYILRIGQRLKLPNGASATAASQTVEQRAAAFSLDIDDVVTGSQPALATNSAPSKPSTATKPVAATGALAIPASFGGRFSWPMRGNLLSKFGSGSDGRVSNGIDIAATRGQPIMASADGVVSYAGDEIAIYGGLILISHGGGWVTAYGYAQRLDVVRGQAVKAGQVIGQAGDTGFAEVPQLHFEIRRDRKPVDPLKYLPAS